MAKSTRWNLHAAMVVACMSGAVVREAVLMVEEHKANGLEQ